MHIRLYSVEEIVALVQNANLKIEDSKALTHYCFPFNHIILYGMKKALDKGILPGTMRNTADKFAWKKKDFRLNIIDLIYMILNKFDRLNEGIPNRKSSVAIYIKAVKVGE